MQGYRLRSMLLAAVSLTAAGSAGAAFAQSPDDATLEEVVVTASRHAVALQDLPMSVSAVTGEKLEQMRARDTKDYILTVPGVSFTDAGSGREAFTVRGISTLGSSGTTARYIDETPLGSDLRLFDIDRVEILRGPQGTLYGVSSMGGALRTITRKPDTTEFAARVDASLNQVSHGGVGGDVNVALNIPVVKDKFAVRIVAYDEKRAGYIDNYVVDRSTNPTTILGLKEKDAGGAEFRGGRLMLRWTPTSDTTVDGTVYYQNNIFDALESEDQDLGKGKLRQGRGFNEAYGDEVTQGNLTIHHAFDFGAELISSTSYAREHITTSRDVTGIYGPYLPLFNIVLGLGNGGNTSGFSPLALNEDYMFKSFVQEVRLASTGKGPLTWVVGGYYYEGDVSGVQNLIAPGSQAVFGDYTPGGKLLVFKPYQPSSEFSVFAEASYNLTSKLQATAGIRRYKLKSAFDQTVQGIFNADIGEILGGDNSSVTELVADKGSAEESGFTYKFMLSYQATDSLLVYGGASSGYRPGGPNAYVPAGQTPTPTKSYTTDKLWQYELGVKSSWFGNRLIANAAIYDIEWTDIQTGIATDGGFSFFTNAGNARSRGAELELQARPVRGLELGAAVSYVDAKFRSAFQSLNVAVGDRLPNIPKVQANLNARYSWPVAGPWNGYVYGSYSYVGSRDNNANQAINMPSYNQISLRAGLERGDWDISLFVNNLADERAITGFENGLGPDRIHYLQPRTIGIALKADF
jgi:iron complex outermembrane receptor protein